MELRQLRYFCAVAEKLSFTNAANELFVSQSAISQQISSMEGELGIQLLERNRHRVALTQAGADFYERLQGILEDLDDSVKAARIIDFSRHYVAKITIGIQDKVQLDAGLTVITDALRETKKEYPHLMIDIVYVPFDQVEQVLLSGKVDAVVALGPQGEEPHFSKSLCSKAFVEEKLFVAVARDLERLSAGAYTDDMELVDLLEKMPMLIPNDGNHAMIDNVFSLYTAFQLPPRVEYCGSLMEVAMRTNLGDGICLLPEIQAGEPGNQKFLRYIPIELKKSGTARKVVWRKGAESGSLQYFLDAIVPFRSESFLKELSKLDNILEYTE